MNGKRFSTFPLTRTTGIMQFTDPFTDYFTGNLTLETNFEFE